MRSLLLDDLLQRRVGDVDLVEAELTGFLRLGEVLAAPGDEIVDHGDLVALGDEPVDEGGTDEPGAAGDENLLGVDLGAHGCGPFLGDL